MEAKHKAYLEELAAKVDAKLLEYVQVTPETRRQAQVVEAMRYSDRRPYRLHRLPK